MAATLAGSRVTGPGDLYRYRATVVRWVDGDTAKVDVDLGVRVHWHGSLRCAGYNAPEVTGSTAMAGAAATGFVEKTCPPGTVVFLDSLAFEPGDELDHFGRMLAAVTLPDGSDLADVMIGAGHAVAYP